jgi:hypothetical protein
MDDLIAAVVATLKNVRCRFSSIAFDAIFVSVVTSVDAHVLNHLSNSADEFCRSRVRLDAAANTCLDPEIRSDDGCGWFIWIHSVRVNFRWSMKPLTRPSEFDFILLWSQGSIICWEKEARWFYPIQIFISFKIRFQQICLFVAWKVCDKITIKIIKLIFVYILNY